MLGWNGPCFHRRYRPAAGPPCVAARYKETVLTIATGMDGVKPGQRAYPIINLDFLLLSTPASLTVCPAGSSPARRFLAAIWRTDRSPARARTEMLCASKFRQSFVTPALYGLTSSRLGATPTSPTPIAQPSCIFCDRAPSREAKRECDDELTCRSIVASIALSSSMPTLTPPAM